MTDTKSNLVDESTTLFSIYSQIHKYITKLDKLDDRIKQEILKHAEDYKKVIIVNYDQQHWVNQGLSEGFIALQSYLNSIHQRIFSDLLRSERTDIPVSSMEELASTIFEKFKKNFDFLTTIIPFTKDYPYAFTKVVSFASDSKRVIPTSNYSNNVIRILQKISEARGEKNKKADERYIQVGILIDFLSSAGIFPAKLNKKLCGFLQSVRDINNPLWIGFDPAEFQLSGIVSRISNIKLARLVVPIVLLGLDKCGNENIKVRFNKISFQQGEGIKEKDIFEMLHFKDLIKRPIVVIRNGRFTTEELNALQNLSKENGFVSTIEVIVHTVPHINIQGTLLTEKHYVLLLKYGAEVGEFDALTRTYKPASSKLPNLINARVRIFEEGYPKPVDEQTLKEISYAIIALTKIIPHGLSEHKEPIQIHASHEIGEIFRIISRAFADEKSNFKDVCSQYLDINNLDAFFDKIANKVVENKVIWD